MTLRIIWKGYDPFIHRVTMVKNTYAKTTMIKKAEFETAKNILQIILPRFAWAWGVKGQEWIEKIIEEYIRTKNVPNEAEEVYSEIMGIYVPETVVAEITNIEGEISKIIPRIERTLVEIGRKIFGERATTGEISVYVLPTPENRVDGTIIADGTIALMVSVKKRQQSAINKVLIREIISVFTRRSNISKILKKVEERTNIPVMDVFAHTVANLVLWRSGIEQEMFSSYYTEDWEEMKELEERVREIIREWWLNGGNMERMLENRLVPLHH